MLGTHGILLPAMSNSYGVTTFLITWARKLSFILHLSLSFHLTSQVQDHLFSSFQHPLCLALRNLSRFWLQWIPPPDCPFHPHCAPQTTLLSPTCPLPGQRSPRSAQPMTPSSSASSLTSILLHHLPMIPDAPAMQTPAALRTLSHSSVLCPPETPPSLPRQFLLKSQLRHHHLYEPVPNLIPSLCSAVQGADLVANHIAPGESRILEGKRPDLFTAEPTACPLGPE